MVTWVEIPDIPLCQRKQYQLWFIDIFIYHLFTSMIYCYLFLSLIRNHMTSHLGSRFKIYAKNIIQSRHKKFIERFKISAKHLICKLLQLLSKTLNQLSWAIYHIIEGWIHFREYSAEVSIFSHRQYFWKLNATIIY